MNNPQKPSANVLGNLERLYYILSTSCSIFSLQIVDFVATPSKLKTLQDVSIAFGMVSACRAMRTIDFEAAEKIYNLCCAVKEQADLEYGLQSPTVTKRCEKLAFDILSDIPVNFVLAGDSLVEIADSHCKTAVFCDFLGCANNCNRSVFDD